MSWETKDLPTESSDSSVFHHIIEAMQRGAEDSLHDNEEYNEVAEKSKTTEEVMEHFMAKGDALVVGTIIAQGILDSIHEVTHDVLGGAGVSEIKNNEIRAMSMDWFRSSEFKLKYKRIIDEYGIDHVKAELGIK